ncbi:MAG TPA: NAD(P)H-hydrate dehydratase [Longimicrobiales bacterium]|jgi:NAD(P)H-hydrate epimerase
MKITTTQEIADLDRRAVQEHGIPDQLLMENAGVAAFDVIHREQAASGSGIEGCDFVVLCGGGNNGGDGFVVARELLSTGARVRTFILGDPEAYGDSARANLEMLREAGADVTVDPEVTEVEGALDACDAVVDALFGTGISRKVGGKYRVVIEAVNASACPVYSLDIPSGVNGDTGAVMGEAVWADHTITFGLPKRGNFLYPGAERCGRLWVSHISYPRELVEAEHVLVEVSAPPPLPPRRVDGHKGTFGDALFIAGARAYFGAPAFAALSHLKAGGGYARLAAPASLVPSLGTIAPEVVFAPQAETPAGTLSRDAGDVILALSSRCDFVVMGPGVSLNEETQELIRRLARELALPVLIDGDGITAVAEDLEVIRGREAPTVLTPHAGEMSRLIGRPTADILADPIPVLQDAAHDLGAIIVLKGAHSLIGLPDRRVFVNTTGNSGMATAGSGDVLTGTVSAMYGLGLGVEDAVRVGLFVHGLAGDLAAEAIGADGMTAQDVLRWLPEAVRRYREGYGHPWGGGLPGESLHPTKGSS